MCNVMHLQVTTFCILTSFVHIHFRPSENKCCPQKAIRPLDFKTDLCWDNTEIQGGSHGTSAWETAWPLSPTQGQGISYANPSTGSQHCSCAKAQQRGCQEITHLKIPRPTTEGGLTGCQWLPHIFERPLQLTCCFVVFVFFLLFFALGLQNVYCKSNMYNTVTGFSISWCEGFSTILLTIFYSCKLSILVNSILVNNKILFIVVWFDWDSFLISLWGQIHQV